MKKVKREFGFKVLTQDSHGPFSYYDFLPALPGRGKVGPWLNVKGRLTLCHNGWHFCRTAMDLPLMYVMGSRVWLIEADAEGRVEHYPFKSIARRIRFVMPIGEVTFKRAGTHKWVGSVNKAVGLAKAKGLIK